MADFDVRNGWIQFAFANTDDHYVLPSTVLVDYRKFLIYQLKKADYRAVIFWEAAEDRNLFRFADAQSQAAYNRIRPEKHWRSSPDEIISLIENMIYGQTKTALVVTIHSFCRYFETAERIQALLRIKQQLANRSSIILITATALTKDSSICFTREGGVLQQLFDEVKQAARLNPDKDLYAALRDNLGSRCVFLNKQFHSNLLYTVKRHLLTAEWQLFASGTEEEARAIAALIEQRPPQLQLPENPRELLCVVDAYLEKPENRRRIAQILEQTGRDKPNALVSGSGKEECPIYLDEEDSFLYRQMQRICRELGEAPWCSGELAREAELICRCLKVITVRGDHKNHSDRLQRSIDSIAASLPGERPDLTLEYIRALGQYLDSYYGGGQSWLTPGGFENSDEETPGPSWWQDINDQIARISRRTHSGS